MTGTRHELAPAVPIQQTIDAGDMHLMLDLSFKGSLKFFRRGNFSLCGSREKGLQKAAFLLHAHVFMTASPFAWRFNRGKSQAVIAGNDAAHRCDRHPCISGDLFGFARLNQGVVNDPPAFSNPRVWVHFHATFDFFHWNMSSGSCDSRSQNRFSSPPSLVPLLYHSERKLVLERDLPLSPAHDFEETFGKGVQGLVPIIAEDTQVEWHSLNDSVVVAVGNRTFMQYLEITIPLSLLSERKRRVDAGQICSYIAVDNQIAGLLVLEDIPREDLSLLSSDLKAAGIKETILLTGDSEVVAHQIGEVAQVDRVLARCMPEDKLRIVQELEHQGHRVLMVGDGINDAPALATATVGMALGSQGLTAAATAADTVLLSTDILRVVKAVRLGRWVMRVALQGIWVGMGLSAIAMIFAAFGFIPPAAGAILQEGIDVIVILNALRVSRIKL
jgi:soluble P-type ATPase